MCSRVFADFRPSCAGLQECALTARLQAYLLLALRLQCYHWLSMTLMDVAGHGRPPACRSARSHGLAHIFCNCTELCSFLPKYLKPIETSLYEARFVHFSLEFCQFLLYVFWNYFNIISKLFLFCPKAYFVQSLYQLSRLAGAEVYLFSHSYTCNLAQSCFRYVSSKRCGFDTLWQSLTVFLSEVPSEVTCVVCGGSGSVPCGSHRLCSPTCLGCII